MKFKFYSATILCSFLCPKYWKFFYIYIYFLFIRAKYYCQVLSRKIICSFFPSHFLAVRWWCCMIVSVCVCVLARCFAGSGIELCLRYITGSWSSPLISKHTGTGGNCPFERPKPNKQLKRSQRSKHIIYLSRLHKQLRISSELLHSSSNW